jgi:MraZ protein
MFQGAAQLNLDAKGRMAIPSRHRDALLSAAAGRVILTAHPHRCLLLYPQPAWEPISAQILAAPSLEPQSAMLRRLLVGFAVDTDMDGAGRILVAPELRRYAGLEKKSGWSGKAAISKSGAMLAGKPSRRRSIRWATNCCHPVWSTCHCDAAAPPT